ncbi:Bug family tripartite tricarboxylate transporter substrate binding protein [Bordetella tumulicola]|uniref:Bug family tripartite tricarboxylate transporter substrate binding protein n=1 Tax=Bordetella tumulicola TaxID=1649133 RepID=UPI0039F13AE3
MTIISRLVSPFWKSLLAGMLAWACVGPAQAAYPEKPVRLVVGFSPGGATDIAARVVAAELSNILKQPFVVENKPGAGSNLAADQVARATPDGYTLFVVAVTSTINQTLYKNLNFDIVKDFAPVGLLIKSPNLLVVNPSLPVNNVQELVDYAKKNPGKLAFASAGTGGSTHMAGELFKLQAGIDMLHVPYRGSAPAMADLIGGQVQLSFDNMPSAWQHVQSGKLRALAVTTKERSGSAPNVPTMAESGFPEFDVSAWFGLVAPAGTPSDVIATLNTAVNQVLAMPAVRERFDTMGAVAAPTTPEQFGDYIKSEVDMWGKVVKASGASAN